MAIDNYSKSIAVTSTFVKQALPRMLTLWFSFAAIREVAPAVNTSVDQLLNAGSKIGRSLSTKSLTATASHQSSLLDDQNKCAEIMKTISKRLTAEKWFECLPQLVSRTGKSCKFNATIVY